MSSCLISYACKTVRVEWVENNVTTSRKILQLGSTNGYMFLIPRYLQCDCTWYTPDPFCVDAWINTLSFLSTHLWKIWRSCFAWNVSEASVALVEHTSTKQLFKCKSNSRPLIWGQISPHVLPPQIRTTLKNSEGQCKSTCNSVNYTKLTLLCRFDIILIVNHNLNTVLACG